MSLSTLVPRKRPPLEVSTFSGDLRFDRRVPGLRSGVLCAGREIGLLLLLAERAERVPLIILMSRFCFTYHENCADLDAEREILVGAVQCSRTIYRLDCLL